MKYFSFLQGFSKQALMIEALINSLSKLLGKSDDGTVPNIVANNFLKIEVVQGGSSDRELTLSGSSSSSDKSTNTSSASVSGFFFSFWKISCG